MTFLVLFLLLIILIQPVFMANSSSFPTREDKEKIFRMMFEAQNKFRQGEILEDIQDVMNDFPSDNYKKTRRNFYKNWQSCDEKYRWPACCLWSEKKKYKRTTSDCEHIKGDVILENNVDAISFQSLLDIREIQGSLVLRNTTILEFGLPLLERIGFDDKSRSKASLIIENNKYLTHLRIRKLVEIVKHSSQKHAIVENNPNLKIDAKQYEIFKKAANGSLDFEHFNPPWRRYIRGITYELWPYFLFGFMIIVVFTHHFIMLEVNEFRMKRKDKEMIDCLNKMRDSTIAAELLIQTPMDVTLAFDMDVLHLCTDQTELIKKIEKLLNENMPAFKGASSEVVSNKE
ncbi:hypothetical protein CRE_24723 [Caenorhabditis remanei]|uniref:Receptor L-domain domain-containing protein n=1 Tax=Caenorhabditis remanei TaxID=31234 RepID=E3N406_CAERE|nr:hypothetical protein CRE_24723 [Caenorhabditis remanei]